MARSRTKSRRKSTLRKKSKKIKGGAGTYQENKNEMENFQKASHNLSIPLIEEIDKMANDNNLDINPQITKMKGLLKSFAVNFASLPISLRIVDNLFAYKYVSLVSRQLAYYSAIIENQVTNKTQLNIKLEQIKDFLVKEKIYIVPTQ